MSKDMNKLKSKITRYDIGCGLFICLLILLFTTKEVALVYMFGVSVAFFNFLISIHATYKWIGVKNKFIIGTTVLRVLFVLICIFPFIENEKFLLAYVTGLITHSVLLIYCGIVKKGG